MSNPEYGTRKDIDFGIGDINTLSPADTDLLNEIMESPLVSGQVGLFPDTSNDEVFPEFSTSPQLKPRLAEEKPGKQHSQTNINLFQAGLSGQRLGVFEGADLGLSSPEDAARQMLNEAIVSYGGEVALTVDMEEIMAAGDALGLHDLPNIEPDTFDSRDLSAGDFGVSLEQRSKRDRPDRPGLSQDWKK